MERVDEQRRLEKVFVNVRRIKLRLAREPILIEFGINVVFKEKYFFFLSTIVNVKEVETTLKVGGVKHILSNISEIIEDTIFMLRNFLEYLRVRESYIFIKHKIRIKWNLVFRAVKEFIILKCRLQKNGLKRNKGFQRNKGYFLGTKFYFTRCWIAATLYDTYLRDIVNEWIPSHEGNSVARRALLIRARSSKFSPVARSFPDYTRREETDQRTRHGSID